MKNILLDLDDTLVDLAPIALRELNRCHEKDHCMKDLVSFGHIVSLYDIDYIKFNAFLCDEFILEKAEMYDTTVPLLTRLMDRGYIINIVTARAWHPHGYDVTKEYLLRNNIPYDNLYVSNHGEDKASYVYGSVHISLDDNVDNCWAIANNEKVKYTFLMDKPWNQNSKFPRIHRLDELADYV